MRVKETKSQAAAAGQPTNLSPGHHQGRYTGYEVDSEGAIEVCHMYRQHMADCLDEHEAINSVIRTVTECASKLMVGIAKRRSWFWNRLAEDYGIDCDEYLYTPPTGKLTKKKETTPKPASPGSPSEPAAG